MAHATLSPLERQLRRARRRLFLQDLLNLLIAWTTSGVLLGTAWFVLQPVLLGPDLTPFRWYVSGGLTGLGVLTALVLAYRRRPSPLDTALTLDERFGLKERVTTSLTLPAEMHASPAGQALLADANERVGGLDLRSRFPFKVSWTAVGACVGVLALAVVAFFYDPARGQAQPDTDPSVQEALDAKKAKEEEDRKKAMAQLQKAGERKDDKGEKDKADEVDDDLTNIAEKPFKTEEQQKERAADLTKAIDKIDQAQKEEAVKDDLIREQLKKDEAEKEKVEDGPAKEFQKALADGDAQKAQEELNKLTQQLKDGKLSPEDQQKLQKQMADMKKDLDRLAHEKDEEKLLKDLAAKGELSKEALERELERMKKEQEEKQKQGERADGKKDVEKLQKELQEMAAKGQIPKEAAQREIEKLQKEKQDLQELAKAAKDLEQAQQAMQQCQQCQQQGDQQGANEARQQAAEALQRAGGRLDGEQSQQQAQKLADQKQRAEAARQAMLEKANQQGGNKEQQQQQAANDPRQGRDFGGPGQGARAEEKDDTASKQVQVKGNPDKSGQSIKVGEGPKGGKNRIKPIEIEAKRQELSQESPGSIVKRGQVSKEKSEVTQEYFELIGGQKKPEEKK